MSNDNDFFASVIVPVSDSRELLSDFVSETSKILGAHYGNHEIILVDSRHRGDGVISEILGKHEFIRYLKLSRASREVVMVNAALPTAIGDVVTVASPDKDDANDVFEVTEHARRSSRPHFGTVEAPKNYSWCMSVTSRIFHWYSQKVLKITVPQRTTGLLSFPRKQLNAFLKIKDTHRRAELLTLYTGYDFAYFSYSPRQQKFMKSWGERFRLAYDITVASSFHPLRLVSWLAVILSFVNLLYILYAFGIFLFMPGYSQGWPSLSIQVSVMFFFVFLVLAVMSEYIGRALLISVNWPQAFIAEERNSSVVPDDERKNVVNESLNEPRP